MYSFCFISKVESDKKEHEQNKAKTHQIITTTKLRRSVPLLAMKHKITTVSSPPYEMIKLKFHEKEGTWKKEQLRVDILKKIEALSVASYDVFTIWLSQSKWWN